MDVLCQTSHKHIPKVKMLTYVLGPSSGISKALPSSKVLQQTVQEHTTAILQPRDALIFPLGSYGVSQHSTNSKCNSTLD